MAFGVFAEIVLFVGEARDRQAVHFKNVLHKPRTVKAAGCRPAEDIRHAHKSPRRRNNLLALIARYETPSVRRKGRRSVHVRGSDFGRGEAASFFLFCLLQSAPRNVGDNARDAYLVVVLKGGDCAFGLVAVNAVKLSYVVADKIKFLLQSQNIDAARVARQRGRGKSRAVD